MNSSSTNDRKAAKMLAGERCMCHSSLLSVALSMLKRRLRKSPRHHARMDLKNLIGL